MLETVTSSTDAQNSAPQTGAVVSENDETKSASTQETEQDETSEASDASKNEETDADGNDADSDGEESKEKASEKAPKKTGAEKRIEKLLKKNSAKDREIEYLKSIVFERQQKAAQGDAEKTESVKKAEPSLSEKPRAEKFDTHEDYVEALADWKVERKLAEREAKDREEKVKAEYQKINQSHRSRVEQYAKDNPDYNDTLQEFLDDHGDVRFSSTLEELVVTSEKGPALIHELLKNPDEFTRINTLGALDAAREIGKLEAKFAKSSESSKETKQLKSNAPPPISPVGSKSGSVKKSIFDKGLSFTEYERIRREEMKSKT